MKNYHSNLSPAVMICNANSIFPKQLADYWYTLGIDVSLVTRDSLLKNKTNETYRTINTNLIQQDTRDKLLKKIYYPLHLLEKTMSKMWFSEYKKQTGRTKQGDWENQFADHLVNSFHVSKVAMTLNPKFVFGHDVSAYGLATVLCHGIPKILFPWGADIFWCPETSPFYYFLIKCTLKSADLIVPSSITAARHIEERFGVPRNKIKPISWGIDRTIFYKRNITEVQLLKKKWKVNSSSKIILNVRRFLPSWGSENILEAFIHLAKEIEDSDFILFGGLGTNDAVIKAKEQVQKEGLIDRFTFFEGDMELITCSELMAISDIFVSFLGRGDMRSSSVLQATASGSIPIILESPEYREMEKLGFKAVFAKSDKPEIIFNTILGCIKNIDFYKELIIENEQYIKDFEDMNLQMSELIETISEKSEYYNLQK